MEGVVYLCGRCKRQISPRDQVVQTVRIRHRSAVSGATIAERLVGEWFEVRCWGSGIPPFQEIDRGPLSEVLERS